MRNPFARKPAAAASPGAAAELQARAEGDELIVAAADGRTPVADWLARYPEAAPGIAALLAAAEDGRQEPDGRLSVEIEEGRARLRPAFVAGLDGAAAHRLGLPAPTPLALDLKPVGRIDEDGFQIATRWVEPGGRPVLARLEGALIRTDTGVRRAPEPLWSLCRAAQALAQPVDRAERFRRLAELQRVWPESERRVQADGYLRDLRVHYASALSLHLDALTPEKTEFSPVLFGARSVAEAEEAGRPLDEELDNVLTPAAQRLFAGDRFPRESEGRPVYVLKDGEFVFIDPALRPALGAVRQLQDASEVERRAFVLNPRQVLRERLGEEAADRLDLDRLFVETEQFSDRVAGVDVWRKPVLPWLSPNGQNQWLPERFGLRVGDNYFVVPPEHAGEVHRRVEDAADAGRDVAPVEGLLEPAVEDGPAPPDLLPVNEQTLAAVRALEPFAHLDDPAAPGTAEDLARPWDADANGKLFLIVRENFEEVEFAPLADEAAAAEGQPVLEAPPARLKTELKPHQLHGMEWLAQCVRARRPGALLADDMGLGKTLQAIAFMAWLQEEAEAGRRPAEPFLIVAPTGLLGTWRGEILKHLDAPRLGLLVPAFGSDLKTLREESGFAGRDIETGRAALKAAAWRDAGVVLTTYETLRDYHFSFARTRFGLVVYDEIQKLKNPASQMTRAAKALNARFVLGMTGTPVENRLQDLWSIMDVVSPGLLGAGRDFDARYPPDDRQALAELKAQLSEPRDGRPAYMLRRLKGEALEGMPGKTVHPFETDMPEPQAQAYRDLAVRAAAGAAGGAIGQGGMLAVLAQMRGVSLHPLDPRQAPDDLDAYAKDSARLAKTLDLLDEIAAKGEKALIFVEDLPMQERLAAMIKARFDLPAAPMRINGAVPGPRRQAMVDRFQTSRRGFDVMILSPKAGGVGLTLTAANHVIHLSRWWNPAVEDQATDRVFRIGQTRDVHVYLPMAVHPDPSLRPSSFDLRLNALIERKRRLTQDLFLPPEADDDDLTGLFREVSLAEASLAEASLAEVPAAEPAPSDKAARPVLRPPRPMAETGARVWVRDAGQPRPTQEVLELFRDRDVCALRIRDPYALGSRGQRAAQARFVAELAKVCRSLESVTIEYAPEVEPEISEAAARGDVEALITRALAGAAPPLTLVRRRRRSRDDDFHDRTVELDIRHAGGAVRQHTLLLGRGLEALFDDRWQCTASYAPPSSN